MKKVIVFALVTALALGGIAFAHAAVTASQDDLLLYPTVQVGDPAALAGRTAELTFACGNHLFWHTSYPFGGEAVTEFVYSRKAVPEPWIYNRNHLEGYLLLDYSSSTTGGSLSLNSLYYTSLLQAVSRQTPMGGSMTMELPMAEYTEFYETEYSLLYEDSSQVCNEVPAALIRAFRFPVLPDQRITVTLEKDGMGNVVGMELWSEHSPELTVVSDVTAEGVWFVPLFRDETGAPLPYESPEGHGIYFVPFKNSGVYRYWDHEVEKLALDVDRLTRVYPLDEGLDLRHIIIDAEQGQARMLLREDGMLVLSTCDLETGTVQNRLDILPLDPGISASYSTLHAVGDYYLILAQGKLALTDAAGERLLLTAPDVQDQRFCAAAFDPTTGDLHFDGETLVLSCTTWDRASGFWAAAFRQGEAVCYGEYGCSLLRGNDDWYYSYVTTDGYPVRLK